MNIEQAIDILNKIANGEDLPIKIQYGYDRNNCCAIWQLNPSLKDYCCNKIDVGDNQLFADYIGDITVVLNNEVEILEDNTEEIEEKSNFENMGYEIAQAYFEFYKGIAKALTEKRKESEDKQ